MSVLVDRASGAGVLDRLQVLRSAPTPRRGAPAATWTPSPRTGRGQVRVPGQGLQPWLHTPTTTRIDPAGSSLAMANFGPKNGVHLTISHAFAADSLGIAATSADLRTARPDETWPTWTPNAV